MEENDLKQNNNPNPAFKIKATEGHLALDENVVQRKVVGVHEYVHHPCAE